MMRKSSITALGAALTLAACGKPVPPAAPAAAEPSGLAYVCQGGEILKADYRAGGALVSFRNETWNMSAGGPQGRYALGARQWQVAVTPDHEEGVLSAVSGGKSVVIARCQKTGALSPAAAALPPPGTAPACTAANLSLKFVGEEAGAGQRGDTFAVANRGTSACSIQGFPEVRLLGDNGQPAPGVTVDQSLRTGPAAGPAQRLTLAPGKRAVFYMHWTPIQSGVETCPHVTRVEVTAPGGKTGLIPLDATPCGGHAEVSPLRADAG
jgi:hypothetical protein